MISHVENSNGMNELFSQPHRRYNPLTGEWVLVSPHRLQRPWQGKVEELPGGNRPAYDDKCYLCPGNERAGGATNPRYENTFVFTNDFAALKPEAPAGEFEPDELMRAETEQGQCRVICFSPRHDLTLAEMQTDDIHKVVQLWREQYAELAAVDYVQYVQIFENKGAIMGCSNPHPHGQIWATSSIPFEADREDRHQREYFTKHGRTLLSDYIARELELGDRLVCRNDHWVALVPYWAKWPFETLVAPISPAASLTDLDAATERDLADILRRLTIRYDNLFQVSFPYTMGIHQAPVTGQDYPHWHMHAHFYPPLLRSATVQKFMVGFEMLAMPQRDITAEEAARRLRELPEVHFNEKKSAQ